MAAASEKVAVAVDGYGLSGHKIACHAHLAVSGQLCKPCWIRVAQRALRLSFGSEIIQRTQGHASCLYRARQIHGLTEPAKL